MATGITAAMERLGCQKIQVGGHHLNQGDRVSFPWERNDEPEGGGGIASSLGMVGDRVPQTTEALWWEGVQVRQGMPERVKE